MALALNNLKRVDMPLNKEAKPKSDCHLYRCEEKNKQKAIKSNNNNKEKTLLETVKSEKKNLLSDFSYA